MISIKAYWQHQQALRVQKIQTVFIIELLQHQGHRAGSTATANLYYWVQMNLMHDVCKTFYVHITKVSVVSEDSTMDILHNQKYKNSGLS